MVNVLKAAGRRAARVKAPIAPEATEATEAAPEATEAAPEATEATEAAPEATEATEAAPEATEATEATPEATEATEATEAAPEATEATEAAPEATEATEATEIRAVSYAFEMENESKGRSVNNSQGVADSWLKKDVRAKRTARHNVRLTWPAKEGESPRVEEFKSVWKAFQNLYAKPSTTRAIKFRGELVAARRLFDASGVLWEIAN